MVKKSLTIRPACAILYSESKRKGDTKMRTYTEEEIKKWFETMKRKYPNSNAFDHLTSVEYMMFNETFGDSNCLKKIKKEA
jgi:hypothetical protein